MHKPIKYVEKAFTYAAGAAWVVFDKFNQINQNPGFVPRWSDKPLLKSWEKTKPPLGWPRETDSLCPKCVPEIRQLFRRLITCSKACSSMLADLTCRVSGG